MNISFFKLCRYGVVLLLAAGHVSCKKEVVHQYEIEEVTLYTSASEKKNLKTDEQFIAILYTDIFGQSISNQNQKKLNRAYASMGDKSLVIDLMIKSLLANSAADLPSENSMRAHPEIFVEEAYKRLLVRKPSKQESWYLVNEIVNNSELAPIDIYYTMLTSEEYRYY